MSSFQQRLLAGALLAASAVPAFAAEVIVDKAMPEHAQKRFFERVQAGDLANAIAKRGQAVDVKPGKYLLRVPCDSMKPGSFSDVTITIDEHSTTRLRIVECGVLMNDHQ